MEFGIRNRVNGVSEMYITSSPDLGPFVSVSAVFIARYNNLPPLVIDMVIKATMNSFFSFVYSWRLES